MIYVQDCPHFGFELKLVEGSHEGTCHDCGVRGRPHPRALKAVQLFDAKINECIKLEKKDGQPAPMERRTWL